MKTTPDTFPVTVYVNVGSEQTLKVSRVLGFSDLIRLMALLDENTECREWHEKEDDDTQIVEGP